MTIVLITALGVGGATLIGALLGFIFKKTTHKFSDIVLSFASGVMLAAAVMGLILPSVEYGGKYGLIVSVLGVFCGAFCVNLIDKLVPHLHKLTGTEGESHPNSQEKLDKVLLFVIAIAIHNLPEGIAAGVGFGTGNTLEALTIAGGIALQNIPEGMVIIGPMLASGIYKSKRRHRTRLQTEITRHTLGRSETQLSLMQTLFQIMYRHIAVAIEAYQVVAIALVVAEKEVFAVHRAIVAPILLGYLDSRRCRVKIGLVFNVVRIQKVEDLFAA